MKEELPEIRESSRFNFVTSIWIVPIVALLIALWLAFQYFSALGPQIEIVFQSNEGLKAGQSQIRFRDVPVGKVEKIRLQKDGDGVTVVARMEKEAIPFLNDEAMFWIVKPEVGIGGVSGLETIISGTYINMMSKKKSMTKEKFIGLEHPFRKLEEGEYFHLRASSAYTVTKGTPIFFKNMHAGSVEYVTMSLDGKSVDVIVYIYRSYADYIHRDTKFWVQSMLSVKYANGELSFDVAPLSQLVKGGIAFSSSGEDETEKVPEDFVFTLYPSSSIASDRKLGRGGKAVKEYRMHFSESVAKLKRDASVRYQNFDVGRVKEVLISYDSKSHRVEGTVSTMIDTSIFTDPDLPDRSGEENLEEAVREGLRASVKAYDPISGLLYVNLDFKEDNRSLGIVHGKEGRIFPTVAENGAGMMDKLDDIVNRISKLPLDQLVRDVEEAVNTLNNVVESNNVIIQKLLAELHSTLISVNDVVASDAFKRMPGELNKTMKELQKTLRSLDSVMKGNSNNSLLSSQLTETLKEVSKASRDTQKILRKLDRKPNSLIFGD